MEYRHPTSLTRKVGLADLLSPIDARRHRMRTRRHRTETLTARSRELAVPICVSYETEPHRKSTAIVKPSVLTQCESRVFEEAPNWGARTTCPWLSERCPSARDSKITHYIDRYVSSLSWIANVTNLISVGTDRRN
jgi:hypothetical protein